jgi:hypothetical protein
MRRIRHTQKPEILRHFCASKPKERCCVPPQYMYIHVHTVMFLLEVAQALRREKVSYCIVGGYAVALHGALRGTIDIDLVISLEAEAFLGVEVAMNKLGLVSRLPIRASEVFAFRDEYIKNRNLIAWGFVDPKNPVRQVDVILTTSVEELSPISFKLKGIPVRVASLRGLIQMKLSSQRPQDIEDVQALRILLERNEK